MEIIKLCFSLCLLFSAISQDVAAQASISTNKDKIALGGYDVVAYFDQYAAVRGSKTHAVKLDEVTYFFQSAEHADTFRKKPEAYLPAYGGYCAFAMAMKGAKVPADPQTFKIRDGKLYLFFNDYYEGSPFNTIVPWNGDESKLVSKANSNWKKQE